MISVFSYAQQKTYYAGAQDKSRVPTNKNKYTGTKHFPYLNKQEQDINWSREFTVPGIRGSVYTMASDGENLYIGGAFVSAGNTAANNIVKWDGNNWIPIGEGAENGLNGAVQGIAFSDGKLFVGGLFSKAGSVDANGVAYWDGSKWNTLGSDSTNGLRRITVYMNDSTAVEPGFAYSLYEHDKKIYIGGFFQMAGTDTTNGVTAWDINTESWETFDGGLGSLHDDDPVYAYTFQAKDDTLFIGGKFYNAGGVPAKNLAKWDGEKWNSAGDANDWVFDMDIDETGTLYIAGTFDTVGNVRASGVAKWNETKWESLGDEDFAPTELSPYIKQIVVYNDDVYVGGTFDRVSDKPANSFAKWDGSEWQIIPGLGMALSELFNGGISAIQVVNNRLFIGGSFTRAGKELLTNVVEWNESSGTWKKLPGSAEDQGVYDGFIYTLGSHEDEIYAGGNFTVTGGIYARNVSKWTGDEWESLGEGDENGIGGVVYTLLVDSNDVFAGGYFGKAGSVEAYHIARWDGTKWSSIGIGVGGVEGAAVYALARSGNYLYVGGHFSVVGDDENYELPANSIARFNLTMNRWESLGKGLELFEGFPGFVNSIDISNDLIYVGGDFTLADGKDQNYIAVLKDTAWISMDKNFGLNAPVTALKVINEDLIAGGYFTIDSVQNANFFARWDGDQWHEIAGGLSSSDGSVFIESILPYKDGFITAGRFDYAGDNQANNLAYYDGNNWQTFGSGTDNLITGVAESDNDIFIGGAFEIAGGYPSISFAKYTMAATSVHNQLSPVNYYLSQNYPNPFNPVTKITYSIAEPGRVKLKIYDILGKELITLVDEQQSTGVHEVSLDASGFASGIYFFKIEANDFSYTRKMIILK